MLKVDIHGIDDLRRKLSYLDLRRVDSVWVKRSTITLQREARIEAPVDTGNLRNKISYTNYTHT